MPTPLSRRRASPIGFRTPGSQEPEKPKLRAAIYARVSTEEQAQTGYSIPAQIEKLEGFARIQEYTLLPAYIDDGYSGKDLERPAVQRLISDGKKKRYDLIMVYKLDRLSRRLSDLVSLGEMFENIDVGIQSITEPFDTTNPAGKLLFNMLGSFAQFERELIGERVTLALRRRRREGKWNGLPPYGYKIGEDGKLKIVDEEAVFVKRVFQLLLENNLGIKLIARKLKIEDTVTRRRDGGWYFSTVWHMLTRPVYAGLITIDGEIVPSNQPAIISQEVFYRAQELLKEKAVIGSETLHSPNILTGLVRCGICRRVMTTGKGKGLHYYACSARVRGEGCRTEYIPARPLEEALLKEIRSVASKPEVIEAVLKEARRKNDASIKNLMAEKIALQRQIESASRLKEEKVRWLVSTLPEKSVASEVSKEIEGQLGNIAALKSQMSAGDWKIQDLQANNAKADIIARYLGEFLDSFGDFEMSKKRMLLQGLVQEVIVRERGDVNVIFTLPLTTLPTIKMEPKEAPLLDEDRHKSVPVELLTTPGGSYPPGFKMLPMRDENHNFRLPQEVLGNPSFTGPGPLRGQYRKAN